VTLLGEPYYNVDCLQSHTYRTPVRPLTLFLNFSKLESSKSYFEMAFKRPSIPERFSSLVPNSHKTEMETLSKRRVSAMSQLSVASSTNDFINAKIENLEAEIAINRNYKLFFQGAKRRKTLTNDEYNDSIKDLELEVKEQENQLMVIRRQHKIISEDIDEVLPEYSTIEGAYSSVLMAKIMFASSKQRKEKKFNQSAYSKNVLSFYGAERQGGNEAVEKYCHITGWQPGKFVKCAHLVPKSLESDELAYLFGVRETVLSEPRNGMFTSIQHCLSIILIWL